MSIESGGKIFVEVSEDESDWPSRTLLLAFSSALREAGVTHLLGLYFAVDSVAELLDQMQAFAEQVVPKIT